ncbi:MAG: Do family serine endopeptidase [Planctomycetes bacterium]|nr:Do family serine endopeptidase [Planctomycetota bacterium]
MSTAHSTRTNRLLARSGVIGLLLLGGAGATVAFNTQSIASAGGTAPSPIEAARAMSMAFREAAKTISPSVVFIVAQHRGQSIPMSNGANPHGGFQFLFPDAQGGQPLLRNHPDYTGQGSGVLVSTDGTIVTNSHVVKDASDFEVTLSDGRKLPAKLLGVDADTDLAALKIDASGLKAARFGSSDELEPGDWVLAVGNPFGLDHTVTSGIISAKGRSEVGIAAYEDFLQTDAPINPGNSGGPLVNLEGEVVGINTAIHSSSGGSDGIGFAIPSSTVQSVLRGLESNGKVERGWLGVSLQPLTSELASSFGLSDAKGALVAQVLPGTPAAKAGFQAGDIVRELDGKQVQSSKVLRQRVADLVPGTKVDLLVERDGKQQTLTVELGNRSEDGEQALARPASPSDDSVHWGVSLLDLTPARAQQLGLSDADGVLITEVAPSSPAERAGLQAGERIVAVAGEAVSSVDQCADLLRKAGKSVRLRVSGANGERFAVLERAENGMH